ncbi:MAG: Ldh family oxidoreductase, partial [Candidatus Norongarragalinales archaeon]
MRVSREKLEFFVSRLLRSFGAKPNQACVTAQAMVIADLRDHATHGISRLPFLVNGIKHRNCVPAAEPKIIRSRGAIAVIDGCKGLGHYVAFRAMREAVRRAKRFGIGAVAVKNSNHFGSAAFYAEIAAREGCIGLVFCNAEAIVPAFEGKRRVFGTNPIAASFPSAKTKINPQGFLTLDLATSSVTRGLLLECARKRVLLPPGFATDEKGVPTRDAKKALDGLILP